MTSPASKPTQSAIAAALGISPRRVRQLIHEQGMPAESIAAALQWRMERAEQAADNATECDELRAERIRLTRAQADRQQFALEVERGQYIRRAEACEHMTRIGKALSAFIARAATEIPAITEGLPRSKAAPIVKARMHELQTKFSDSSSEFWKSHPEKD